MGFFTISRFKTEIQTWTTSRIKAYVCWLLFCFSIKMHCLPIGCCQPDANLHIPGERESSLRKYLHGTGLKANLWGIVLKWKVPAHIDRGIGWEKKPISSVSPQILFPFLLQVPALWSYPDVPSWWTVISAWNSFLPKLDLAKVFYHNYRNLRQPVRSNLKGKELIWLRVPGSSLFQWRHEAGTEGGWSH